MSSVQLKALVEKHAQPEYLERELALLDSLPDGKSAVVKKRLAAIDAYSKADRPTRKDAAAVAERLGLSVSGFYNIVRKMEKHGPVTGLVPYQQRTARPSMERDGLPEVAEAAVQALLDKNPEEASTVLEQAANEALAAAGLEKPAPDTLRRRIRALRGSDRARHLRIGDEIRVVQTRHGQGHFSGDEIYSWASFLLDARSRVVLGVGDDIDPLRSFEIAVRDAGARIDRIAESGLPFSANPARLSLEAAPDVVRSLMARAGQLGAIELVEREGDDFPALMMRTIVVEGERPDGDPLSGMSRMLPSIVDRWNAKILTAHTRKSRRQIDDGSVLKATVSQLIPGNTGHAGSARIAV